MTEEEVILFGGRVAMALITEANFDNPKDKDRALDMVQDLRDGFKETLNERDHAEKTLVWLTNEMSARISENKDTNGNLSYILEMIRTRVNPAMLDRLVEVEEEWGTFHSSAKIEKPKE